MDSMIECLRSVTIRELYLNLGYLELDTVPALAMSHRAGIQSCDFVSICMAPTAIFQTPFLFYRSWGCSVIIDEIAAP